MRSGRSIRLAEILGSPTYNDAASQLTLGLGKDIVGAAMVADLAKMPHCLVAGTTGSGKSVGINAMILSLLYKAEARDVRMIFIDPKMLELSVYEGIPHLLAPVVTDMKQAANALNWCVGEMERRYKLLSKLGVRQLAGYNRKIADAAQRGEIVPNPFSLTPDAPEPLERLPSIVVVIDELADLMMVVGKKIEELIARLAQKARAAGIHLILATQRPSVDVITGLIKANIPVRLSFQVSSKIDSRTILDQMGAEALLGQGDMLYLPPGGGLPIRVHGAFVGDEEVHRVVEYLKSQGEPNYIDGILEGGAIEGDAASPAAKARAAATARPMRCTTRRSRSCCSTVARRSRWCSAICASATTAPRDCWNKWRNPGSYRAWRPTATATCWCQLATSERSMKYLIAGRLAGACAGAARADAVDTLKEFVRDVKTGSAAFTQTVYSPDGAKKKTSSGSFEFSRPNRFRFEYKKPFEQLIVGDGQKIWIYDADLNQVSSRRFGQALGATPAAVLAGSSTRQGLRPRALPDGDGLAWAQATPKAKDGTVQSLRIGFKGKQLAAIEILDAFGQRSLLQFSQVVANPQLGPSSFRFKPPPGRRGDRAIESVASSDNRPMSSQFASVRRQAARRRRWPIACARARSTK